MRVTITSTFPGAGSSAPTPLYGTYQRAWGFSPIAVTVVFGTYALAVLAQHHGLPFYIVAPSSTVDHSTETGAGIPIEERDPAEVTARFPARNPAFDVTPAGLIAAIVTERGVHRAPYAESLAA